MHRHGGLVFGKTGAQGDHPRNVLRMRRLAHAAEDGFIHDMRINAGLGEQCAHGHAAQFHRVQICKRGAGAAKRGAHAIDNHESWFHG